MIKPLEIQDQRHLVAAQGWLELGDHLEANEELEQITVDFRAHPAVLEVRWQVYAKAKKWEGALDIASALIQLLPELPLGWVHRSYCLHELKRTEEARENLLGVVDRFPDDAIMRYNLACYECQLGRLEQARNWLEKAFALGDAKKIKPMRLRRHVLRSVASQPHTILERQSSQTSVGQVRRGRSAIEVGRLFADMGQRIKTVSAVGLVTCVRLHELPDGCYAPLAHARLAPASGLDEARGLPPLQPSRVVP